MKFVGEGCEFTESFRWKFRVSNFNSSYLKYQDHHQRRNSENSNKIGGILLRIVLIIISKIIICITITNLEFQNSNEKNLAEKLHSRIHHSLIDIKMGVNVILTWIQRFNRLWTMNAANFVLSSSFLIRSSRPYILDLIRKYFYIFPEVLQLYLKFFQNFPSTIYFHFINKQSSLRMRKTINSKTNALSDHNNVV